MLEKQQPISIALPKGRLQEQVQQLFLSKGIHFSFENRKLVAGDEENQFNFFLVKNSDLPTYVNYGIAGLGFCGEDVLYEADYPFYRLMTLPFGSTKICLAGIKGQKIDENEKKLRVATKFTRFTADYYNRQGIQVDIVKLNGSVELAPVLGLAPAIVDLVETGSTLKANNLEVYKELQTIEVKLICNPAYYKINYERINRLVQFLSK